MCESGVHGEVEPGGSNLEVISIQMTFNTIKIDVISTEVTIDEELKKSK